MITYTNLYFGLLTPSFLSRLSNCSWVDVGNKSPHEIDSNTNCPWKDTVSVKVRTNRRMKRATLRDLPCPGDDIIRLQNPKCRPPPLRCVMPYSTACAALYCTRYSIEYGTMCFFTVTKPRSPTKHMASPFRNATISFPHVLPRCSAEISTNTVLYLYLHVNGKLSSLSTSGNLVNKDVITFPNSAAVT